MALFKQLRNFVSSLVPVVGSVVAGGVLISGVAHAANYGAGIEDSHWEATEPSKLYCELWHEIPGMGTARFTHRSGEDVEFFLEPKGQPLRKGKAELIAMPADWQPGMPPLDIGKVDVQQGEAGVRIGSEQTHLMIDALGRGMNPTFLQEPSDKRFAQIRGHISALKFQKAYRKYIDCAGELLPVNYDQIGRSVVYFPGGGFALTNKDRDLLDLIVRYINADETVKYIYLDGHSDSYGSRRDNRKLSKERTDAVLNYLLDIGVDEAMITARYHGERYPIVPNSTKANRAKNRRVTIRLERSNRSDGALDLRASEIDR